MPQRVSKLITIDPVSRRNVPNFEDVERSVTNWINVNAQGNPITSIGGILSIIGGKWGDNPKESVDTFIDSPHIHDDFDKMMRYIDENGNSAQQILNENN